VSTFFIPLNLRNSYVKRLLSDGFNMTAIGNSPMKSHSSQTLGCTLWDTQAVILLENFFILFDYCGNLSETLFIKRFLPLFFIIFAIKSRHYW